MYELLETESRDQKKEEPLPKMRRSGFIPGIIFGKDIESISVKILESNLIKLISKKINILELSVDEKNKILVNIENIQKHLISGKIQHVSFQILNKGQKTTVTIPVSIIGESSGVKAGGVLVQNLESLTISSLPKDVPAKIEVNIEGLEINGKILLKDIKLSKELELTDKHSDDTPVVSCNPAKASKEEEIHPTESKDETSAEEKASENQKE